MANDALINLLAWCQREREQLQMQREMLKAGRCRILENDDSGPRDISNQHLNRSPLILQSWIGSWLSSTMLVEAWREKQRTARDGLQGAWGRNDAYVARQPAERYHLSGYVAWR